MATQTLNRQLLSFSMTVGTNEDWVDGLGAYLDVNSNPLSFARITLNFGMRQMAPSNRSAVVASTAATVGISSIDGNGVVGGRGNNVPALSVPLAIMSVVHSGVCLAELQEEGDGLTRTIGSYVDTVVQGNVRP